VLKTDDFVKSKTLDAGRWTLDAGRWTLDAGRWTLDNAVLPLIT